MKKTLFSIIACLVGLVSAGIMLHDLSPAMTILFSTVIFYAVPIALNEIDHHLAEITGMIIWIFYPPTLAFFMGLDIPVIGSFVLLLVLWIILPLGYIFIFQYMKKLPDSSSTITP